VPERLPALFERTEPLRIARELLGRERSWVVGGTVRDLLLGRRVVDFDLVVDGESRAAAKRLAKAIDGHVFELSERFGAWRVIAPDRAWQADLTPVRGGGIEADLALRDFTINAMAAPLRGGSPLIDPHGGQADLAAARVRALGERAYRDDPLRTLRTARIACELGFGVEPATKALAAAHSPAITASASSTGSS
jgi:tRNA nucleotidyltransferase/poly(A) polymerase